MERFMNKRRSKIRKEPPLKLDLESTEIVNC